MYPAPPVTRIFTHRFLNARTGDVKATAAGIMDTTPVGLRAYLATPETRWFVLLLVGLAAVVGAHALRRRTGGDAPGWILLAPFAAAAVVFFQPLFPQLSPVMLVGGLLALGILVVAVRRPADALVALIVFLPFPTVVFAYLFSLGAPLAAMRAAASWKEVLAIGILVAAIAEIRRTRKPLDRLDLVALGFVAFVAAYALVPRAFVADAPLATTVRSYGFRTVAAFVLLFFACRHAPFPAGTARRAGRALLATCTVIAAIGLIEFFASDWWNAFMVDTVQIPRYQQLALDFQPLNPLDVRVYSPIGGVQVVRVSSVILDPVGLGFFLLGGLALALEQLVQGVTRGFVVVQLLLIGAVLILTQTRSALLGACAICFLAFGRHPGRQAQARARLGILLAVGVIIAVPFAGAQGLTERATGSLQGEDEGTSIHIDATSEGLRRVITNPFGSGLGTGPGALRFSDQSSNLLAAHDWYLSIGHEVGLVPMILFIVLTVAVARALRRAGARGDPVMTAIGRQVLIGVGLGAILIDALVFVPVAWTTWAIAGVALGSAPLLLPARHPATLRLREVTR